MTLIIYRYLYTAIICRYTLSIYKYTVAMWRVCVMEYYSAIKNEIMPFAATWMDLEITILSEVSQRKTNIIWYHLYVESKIWYNELIYKTETDSQT